MLFSALVVLCVAAAAPLEDPVLRALSLSKIDAGSLKPGHHIYYTFEAPMDMDAADLIRVHPELRGDVLPGASASEVVLVGTTASGAALAAAEAEGFVLRGTKMADPFKDNPRSRGYFPPDQLLAEFERLAGAFPALAQFVNLSAAFNLPLTQEGNTIWAMKVSDNAALDEDEPNFLLVSNHHAREVATPEMALNYTARLLEGYGVDTRVTQVVDSAQIYIIFTLNPDGWHWCWEEDEAWRKNRKYVDDYPWDGYYGVDLNRNYPFGWNSECGGSDSPASDTYQGDAPASEPETQVMMALQIDRKFAKVMDLHSFAREVRVNYGDCASIPAAVDSLQINIANLVAAEMDYDQARSCCVAGDIHYAYHDHGSLAFLVETSNTFNPEPDELYSEINRVWPGVLAFFEVPITIHGHVRSAATGNAVSATLAVAEISWKEGEINASHPATGRYHLWLPAGRYTVTVSAAGYQTATVTLTSSDAPSADQDIFLVPVA